MVISYIYFEPVNSKQYNLIRTEHFIQFIEDTMPKSGDHRVGAYCGSGLVHFYRHASNTSFVC